MDGRDVLRFCDFDVAYERRLFEAIDHQWLVPFLYLAISMWREAAGRRSVRFC